MKSRGVVLLLAPALILIPVLGRAQAAASPGQSDAAKSTAKSPDPASAANADGRALLARVIDALGGAAKLQSVHSLRLTSVVDAKTEQGEFTIDMEQLAAFPDRSWQKLGTPMGELTVVTTPTAGLTPQGTQDLADDQKQDAMRELKTSEIQVAQHAGDPKYTFTLAGTEKMGGVDVQILDVNADGAQVRWYVDPNTGRVLRTSAHVVDMGGAAQRLLDFSDWKEFGGIPFPTKAKITRDGREGGSLEVKDIEINPTVDDKLFAKPQS
jgi:Outer membrane lipoprotein-sorting protein